jgi:hypothetical protein
MSVLNNSIVLVNIYSVVAENFIPFNSSGVIGVHYIAGKSGLLFITIADEESSLCITFQDTFDFNQSLRDFFFHGPKKAGFHLERLAVFLSNTGYSFENFYEINHESDKFDPISFHDEVEILNGIPGNGGLVYPKEKVQTDKFWLKLRSPLEITDIHLEASISLARMACVIGRRLSKSSDKMMSWSYLSHHHGADLCEYWQKLVKDTHYNTIFTVDSEIDFRFDSEEAIILVF